MTFTVVWFKRDLRGHDHAALLYAPAEKFRCLTSRMHKKQNLPSKQCPQCGLPFVWRKKWAKTWDGVKYCSARCRQARKRVAGEEGAA